MTRAAASIWQPCMGPRHSSRLNLFAISWLRDSPFTARTAPVAKYSLRHGVFSKLKRGVKHCDHILGWNVTLNVMHLIKHEAAAGSKNA